MRAFIYCRFSSHKQQELSIEGQLDVCTEYAQKHNITVVGEYIDRARSARTENRNDFRRLIRDATTGVVDCVLVWRYDRFFRNRAESALYRKQLEAAGVHLISVTEFIPDGSAGIITQGMIETVAEYFSAKLSEDTIRGMNKAAEHFQVTGPPALGYRSGPDKQYQIDPVGAELVKRIFEWYDSGKSMRQLVEILNKEGHKTARGKPFTSSTFSTILRNKKYIGIYEYGDVCQTGAVPRIIEDELFFRVQRKMELNRHRPGAYKAEVPYLLSGKLFCGLCGSPMTGTAGTSRNNTRYYYYICNNRRVKACSKKNVKLDLIEEVVLQSALDALTDENIAYISAEVERRCAERSDAAALLSSLRAQLAEVEKQLKNIGAAIALGIITETTKQMLMDAEADRAGLRQQIERATVQTSLEVKAEAVACWLDGFRHGDRKDPGFRKQVFGALVHSVYVYEDYLKIIFNIDKARAVLVPFSAVQNAGGTNFVGAVNGSYLDGSGSPKKTSLSGCLFSLSKILTNVDGQLFFQVDQAFCDILGYFIRGFVLIQIAVQGFYAHVTAVGHKIGDGAIGILHSQLHVGLHPGHPFGNGIGILAVVLILVQQLLDFVLQPVVLLLALRQLVEEGFVFHMVQNIVDGSNSHFHTGVALPQQLDGILFDHNKHSFALYGDSMSRAGNLMPVILRCIFSPGRWKNKDSTMKGVMCLFKHEKQLFHPVAVERPNPQYAALLQEQLGGANGELKAAMQYMSQSFRIKDQKIKDLFLDIAAEELGHMEMVAQTINLLNGHDVEAGQVGAGEIQSHVLLGLNPGLINASGYSWTGDYVTVTGDLCADLLSNIASEQRAKVVYEYLYRQIDDKRVRETIDFLLNREEAHNQMFRDAFNQVQQTGSNRDFGTTKAAKMYFSLSDPGPNAFAGNNVSAPKFFN